MVKILDPSLPYNPWRPELRRLPGTKLMNDEWLMQTESYDAQTAYRRELWKRQGQNIFQLLPEAETAAEEAVALLSAHAPWRVPCDLDEDLHPFLRIGLEIQEDICLLAPDDTLTLMGAVLCFPAGWTLSEKIGHSLLRIHAPVDVYAEDLNRKITRMLQNLHPARPIWRCNAHLYASPELYTPLREAEREVKSPTGPYLRSERQVLRKLPISGYLLFTIHSFMLHISNLNDEQKQSLITYALAISAVK